MKEQYEEQKEKIIVYFKERTGVRFMETDKKIYIADDDAIIREAMKTFLVNEGFHVIAFVNGDSLFKYFTKEKCDLIVLDVMMPGSNGFVICTEIRKISTVPIIMLTARDSEFDYATGLSLGSDDYFTKPFSTMALVMRVKAIFRRIEYEKQKNQSEGRHISSLKFGNISISLKSKVVTIDQTEIALTPNEYDVLKYLMEHSNQAVSRDELLENVWGYYTEIETRATDDTVCRIRKKIENCNVGIETVWGYGFRLKESVNGNVKKK